ncbi:hypothetical protein [Streptomyces sp. NPDC047079]|uniref:hypothetical protein n=1 Tax=Streptomyces sp. NPDC047079 TaxID=3154607 RepID=UPI0033F908A2
MPAVRARQGQLRIGVPGRPPVCPWRFGVYPHRRRVGPGSAMSVHGIHRPAPESVRELRALVAR